MMTTMIVGGGPTGVEMAGAVAELDAAPRWRGTSAISIRALPAFIWSKRGRGYCRPFPESHLRSKPANWKNLA